MPFFQTKMTTTVLVTDLNQLKQVVQNVALSEAVANLIQEAERRRFHDFDRRNAYPCPKVELLIRLQALVKIPNLAELPAVHERFAFIWRNAMNTTRYRDSIEPNTIPPLRSLVEAVVMNTSVSERYFVFRGKY